MAVFLPIINKMEIKGFNKIFKDNFIRIDFNASLNMILGGNGLGKTTLLQCIVYALTGGLKSPEVEANKNYRWDNDYFKRRVLPSELNSSQIMINFDLGSVSITVERGLINNSVLECYVDQEKLTDKSFEDIVTEYGQYDNFDSFIFVVNRLLYLSENRRPLTWDYDAQVRSLMILSNDIVNEKAYRSLRAEIKNLDSTKRHTTVKINKINNILKQEEKKIPNETKKITESATRSLPIDVASLIERRAHLSESLQTLLNKRDNLSASLKEYENIRKELVNNIEYFSNLIREYEADYLRNNMFRFSEKENLLIGKTINFGICPCCGELSTEFQQLAKQRVADGKCLICGSMRYKKLDDTLIDISTYNSQLNEKLLARDNANKHIFQLRNQIQAIDENIFTIRKDISTIEYSTFVNADTPNNIFEPDEDNEDADIEVELAKLISDRTDLESEIKLKTTEADTMYESFLDNFSERKNRLSVIYKELSSAFLGKTVTLAYEKSPAAFVSIDYLIPVFDGEVRRSPEDCSEAQRFFLDIAFRMSLIVLNYDLTETSGTFICETPESALDVSYVDNVVKMFFQFIENGNKLILSNNLQRLGLASLLVSRAKKEGKKFTIFDLLEYGKLSDVQQNYKSIFKIRDSIYRVKKNEY